MTLSDFLTHTSFQQSATNMLLTKNKLSSLCNCVLAVIRLIVSGKKQVLHPERDNQETGWALNLTRMEKHSNCPSFLELRMSPVVLRHGASSSTCSVDPRSARVQLSWILAWTYVKLCTTVMKQVLCTSLSPGGRHGNDCHTHDPTFLVHVWIARERSDRTRCQ